MPQKPGLAPAWWVTRLVWRLFYLPFLLYSYNSFEAVKTLMEYNADPSLKDADGATPLHFAARHGCAETSKLLLSNSSSSVNCPDNSGMTPFHLACARGSLELCELFLEHRADIRARTVEEKSPLHLAAWHGNKDIVQLLIKEGWFKNNISNTKDRVWPHLQTPRRELKIRRPADNFWRISGCFEMWPNTVWSVWNIF